MNLWDFTWPDPAANLATDEALLDAAEAGEFEAVLRFWESRPHFVVVGYSNHVSTEVDVAACGSGGVPIFRRCTGGGAVVQGPGCLNYAVVLPLDSDPALRGVVETNRYVMERQRVALSRLLGRPVTFDGHTDLAVDGRKVSGNSQRRKRTHLLFHGTFLLGLDLSLMAGLLRRPSRQPAYRRDRPHGEFVINLDCGAPAIKQALAAAWGADASLATPPMERVQRLVVEKYTRDDWNFKF